MRIALTLTTLLSLAPAALANPASSPKSTTPAPAPVANKLPAPGVGEHVSGDCERARKAGKTCVLDMSGENVDGGVPKNSGLDTTVTTYLPQTSLIRIRRDFIDEIVKTADDL